jgi:tetratricopeptide (TPR) repeat protein
MAAGTLVRAGNLPGAWKLAQQGLGLCGEVHDLTWAQLQAYDLQRREAQDPDSPGIPLDSNERREVSRILFEARAADRGWLASIGFACFASREEVLEQDDPLTLTVWAGEFRQARDLWRARADRAEARGQIARSVSAWAHLARCHAALGEFEEARAAYTRGEELAKRLPSATTQVLNLAAARAEMTWAQAQGWAELIADIFGPLLQQAVTERNWILAVSRAACASAYAWQGQREPAFRLLDTLTDPLDRAPGWAPNYAITAILAADVLWQLERPRLLTTIERNLRAKVVEPDFRTPMLDGRLAVARLCALDGRLAEAVSWFADAREVLREQGARPLLAIVDFDQGLSHVRRADDGDRALAEPFLEAARQQFATLGMAGWLARCEGLLATGSE